MGLIGVALSFGKCYSTSVIGETLGSQSVVYDVSLSRRQEKALDLLLQGSHAQRNPTGVLGYSFKASLGRLSW